MTRAMIVPAAGRGSRLGAALPKALVPVNGRPMIEHILERYRDVVECFLLVVSPSAAGAVSRYLGGRDRRIEILLQATPTGMLDAILGPLARVKELGCDQVWVTWCDQVAVRGGTVERLAAAMEADPRPALAFPTVMLNDPYIHFARDARGRIEAVRHRREGDVMPERGEGDIGLFAMTASTYLDLLPRYAAVCAAGASTGERNFLPAIAWLAARGTVATIPATSPVEAIGINTPEDLERVSAALRSD